MVKLLDCTLRDGGYCNKWNFGKRAIDSIINSLIEAGADIIECGFLNESVQFSPDNTRRPRVEDFSKLFPNDKKKSLAVCMANFGDCHLENIPVHDDSMIDGIRVAFHKKAALPAMDLCHGLKEKGYKVFVQAMVSLNYSDEEFIQLIKRVNDVEPYAFYIVDSFGVMKRSELLRLFYIVEHNLKRNVAIGYHSHNNMQLSYANAQTLADMKTKHDVIIDASIFGMGRGAGNLNTELFLEYLNENPESSDDDRYNVEPLLSVIDDFLLFFYNQNPWGYSLPNYLSAKYNAHPNYAAYLDDKKKLTIESMNEIFSMMDDEKRLRFDKNYIENLYESYMQRGKKQATQEAILKEKVQGKTLLVVAPGKSSSLEKDNIRCFFDKKRPIVISVNFFYKDIPTDFIFMSNLKRFRELDMDLFGKCIVTSNMPPNEVYLRVDYTNLLNDKEIVRDNAGLMLIKLLIECEVREIFLAGFDGYSHDIEENYFENRMMFVTGKATLDAMNAGLTEVLKDFAQKVPIKFLTKERHIYI